MAGPDHELAELLGLEQPALEVALDALVLRGADAVATLRELELRTTKKPLRKLVRRALHRLKTGGVDIGQEESGAARSVLRPIPRELERGAVTPPDPIGVRTFFLVVSSRGGCRIYDGRISDERGVLQVKGGETGRREARNFLRELPARSHGRAALVSAEAVRRLVQDALEDARAAGFPAPLGVSRLTISEILDGPIGATPGEELRAALDPRLEPLNLESARLIVEQRTERGVVPAWLLSGSAIDEAAKHLLQLENSPLVLLPAQRQTRIEEILEAASREVLDGGTCHRLGRRLEETAVFLLAAGDPEGARGCVALAEGISAPPEPARSPYLRSVVRRACSAARGEVARESSSQLILPP